VAPELNTKMPSDVSGSPSSVPGKFCTKKPCKESPTAPLPANSKSADDYLARSACRSLLPSAPA